MSKHSKMLRKTIALKETELKDYQDKMNQPDTYVADRVHWTNQISDIVDSLEYHRNQLAISERMESQLAEG